VLEHVDQNLAVQFSFIFLFQDSYNCLKKYLDEDQEVFRKIRKEDLMRLLRNRISILYFEGLKFVFRGL